MKAIFKFMMCIVTSSVCLVQPLQAQPSQQSVLENSQPDFASGVLQHIDPSWPSWSIEGPENPQGPPRLPNREQPFPVSLENHERMAAIFNRRFEINRSIINDCKTPVTTNVGSARSKVGNIDIEGRSIPYTANLSVRETITPRMDQFNNEKMQQYVSGWVLAFSQASQPERAKLLIELNMSTEWDVPIDIFDAFKQPWRPSLEGAAKAKYLQVHSCEEIFNKVDAPLYSFSLDVSMEIRGVPQLLSSTIGKQLTSSKPAQCPTGIDLSETAAIARAVPAAFNLKYQKFYSLRRPPRPAPTANGLADSFIMDLWEQQFTCGINHKNECVSTLISNCAFKRKEYYSELREVSRTPARLVLLSSFNEDTPTVTLALSVNSETKRTRSAPFVKDNLLARLRQLEPSFNYHDATTFVNGDKLTFDIKYSMERNVNPAVAEFLRISLVNVEG